MVWGLSVRVCWVGFLDKVGGVFRKLGLWFMVRYCLGFFVGSCFFVFSSVVGLEEVIV